jgi:hypothetical protein
MRLGRDGLHLQPVSSRAYRSDVLAGSYTVRTKHLASTPSRRSSHSSAQEGGAVSTTRCSRHRSRVVDRR